LQEQVFNEIVIVLVKNVLFHFSKLPSVSLFLYYKMMHSSICLKSNY